MFRVYKDYDGNAPDSESYALFEHEQDAMKAVMRLNELLKAGKEPIFQVEGWEWRARWKYSKASLDPMTFEQFEQKLQTALDEAAEFAAEMKGDENE